MLRETHIYFANLHTQSVSNSHTLTLEPPPQKKRKTKKPLPKAKTTLNFNYFPAVLKPSGNIKHYKRAYK